MLFYNFVSVATSFCTADGFHYTGSITPSAASTSESYISRDRADCYCSILWKRTDRPRREFLRTFEHKVNASCISSRNGTVCVALISKMKKIISKYTNRRTKSGSTGASCSSSLNGMVCAALISKMKKIILKYTDRTTKSGSTGYCGEGQQGTSYETSTNGTTLIEQQDDGALVCCNGRLYENDIYKCCEGYVRRLPELADKSVACCGRNLMDEKKYSCHNGTMYGVKNVNGSGMKNPVSIYSKSEHINNNGSAMSIATFVLCVCALLVVGLILTIKYRILKCMHVTSSTLRSGESTDDVALVMCQAESSTNNAVNVLKQTANISKINLVSRQSVGVQTNPNKTVNLKNSLGMSFCCQHTFDKNNKSLRLQHSDAKLTVSEQDVSDNKIVCFSSTFRNLFDVYTKLSLVMDEKETICSPAVEYYMPDLRKMMDFASLEIPYVGFVAHLHVWKLCSDEGLSKPLSRIEIPHRKNINVHDNELDAFYEETSAGKIFIYLKTFCWLVCTTCLERHPGFGLQARIFYKEISLAEETQIIITLYIVDHVLQLQDYEQVLMDHEKALGGSLIYNRQINLPDSVALVDMLHIRIVPRSNEHGWHHLLEASGQQVEPSDQMISLGNITKCHKLTSHRNGLPFAKEWQLFTTDVNPKQFDYLVKINCYFQEHIVAIPENTFRVFIHEFNRVKKIGHPIRETVNNNVRGEI